eukprot:TRINITY_DN10034_c0_g2_i3.p1 TRINITY_DN10034_c0_g2~~TRINITY_DN10034_c0_g2_i3.p1  ORF type:complete len:144 (+),score=35.22 TRINITY_DN10034_c0_g2_i3:89-520(+)
MSEEKDHVIFTTPDDETDFVEEKDALPVGADVGEAVGPGGEIDWDCPCLQGMTDGPCGEKFKDAFSCFVYSQEEEKGSDCINQFQAMQECLVANADYYGFNDEEENKETTEAATDSSDVKETAEAVTEVAIEAAESVAVKSDS